MTFILKIIRSPKSCLRLINRVFLLYLIVALSHSSVAQSAFLTDELGKYPFIKADSSVIKHVGSLYPFYAKLNDLKYNKCKTVRIVHVGDSHLQAGFFSVPARTMLSKEFGNAGRGFIFPYSLAKSNSPPDYRVTSEVNWIFQRNAHPTNTLAVGLAGFTIYNNMDFNPKIHFRFLPDNGVRYNNNYLYIYHEKTKDAGNAISVLDSAGNIIAHPAGTRMLENSTLSKFKFDKPAQNFTINISRLENFIPSEFYGFSLESDTVGIVYHTIGVNGAEYNSFLKSEYFIEQLTTLKPDLVIISLGTNEAFDRDFEAKTFLQQVDTFVKEIKHANPDAVVMLTIPGETLVRKGRRKKAKYVNNPILVELNESLIKYCNSENIAYWDQYTVMGGKGSMAQWFAKGMADKKRIHFNKTGYLITGELFYDALMKGFNEYQKTLISNP